MENNSLQHHGIKGQKWGVRNGPPYPLGASDHSASEKKAGYQSSLLKKKKNNKKVGRGKLSDNTKVGSIDPALVDFGISVVTTVAYVATIKILADKAQKDDIKKNKENNHSNIQKRIKGSHSETQDMKEVNPGYNTGKLENAMNCTMCSTAYELRRRGYDVRANVTTRGRKMEDIQSWFDIPKESVNKSKNYYDMKDKLNKEPEGARGNICSGVGAFDSYHSMVWEKKNGKIIIRDAQTNKVYDSMDDSIINRHSSHKYQYVRTDNAEINWDNIKDAVVEREG